MVEPLTSDTPVSSREQHSNGVGGGDGAAEQPRPGGVVTTATATTAAVDNPPAAAAQPSPSTAPLSEDEKPLCVLVIGECTERNK